MKLQSDDASSVRSRDMWFRDAGRPRNSVGSALEDILPRNATTGKLKGSLLQRKALTAMKREGEFDTWTIPKDSLSSKHHLRSKGSLN